MDALGTFLLFVGVGFLCWPERFGRWLATVERARRRALSEGDRHG